MLTCTMICVIQRVSEASVAVGGQVISHIGPGLLVLSAVHATDQDDDIDWTARKLASLRIFAKDERNFDLDVKEIGGSILLVSNFTVAADVRKGRRPSLDAAASPQVGREKFDRFVTAVRALGVRTETGEFGADMKVSLANEGPVTFILNSRER
jgi:D-tyrosyl-tRNA(Tyr) deacylase